MWSQLIKVASLSKGALVVGVAASAAMVSTAEFSNTPSQPEVPSATPIVSTAPAASSHPANSPSSRLEPKKIDVPAQLPASTTPPAPSAQPGLAHGEVPGVIKECVEKYLALREAGDNATNGERESTGAVCKAALAISGLSGADFWAKFGSEIHITAPKTDAPKTEMPKPATSELLPGVKHWVQECVTKYSNHAPDATATCIKAIELTDLTSSQFAERFLKTTKPTTTPSTKPATAEFEQLVYICRKLQGAITDSSTSEQFNAARATCDKAITASGLSTAEFWAKWPPLKLSTPPVSTPKPTTKPVANTTELSQLVAKCLDLYKTITSAGGDTKAASEACRIAIQASGLSSADFWAKYHPVTTPTN